MSAACLLRHRWRRQGIAPVLGRDLRVRVCMRCGKVRGHAVVIPELREKYQR